MRKDSKFSINRLIFLTITPRIFFGIPILLAGLNIQLQVSKPMKLNISVLSVTIILEVIYFFLQKRRLKRVLRDEDMSAIYRTPLILGIHTLLNFILFAPILESIINFSIKIVTIKELLHGTFTVSAIGIVEFGLVYCISYLLMVPLFKSYKETNYRGLNLTYKLILIIGPALVFSLYSGFIASELWIGYLYFLLPLLLVYAAIRFIKEPVDSLLNGFKKFLSDNPDLSMKLNVVSGDEFERMAENFHKFLDIISEIVNEIKKSADEVHSQAENLSAGVEEVTASSQQITSSIQGINEDAQDIDLKVDSVKGISDNIYSLSAEIESQMDSLKDTAAKSVELANSGEKKSESSLEKIDISVNKMKEGVENLEKLVSAFEEVKEFTSLMEKISDDTNLLALNASIEATRVEGESEGFGVIADEIRKLSTDSASYLEKTRESIRKMNEAVELIKDTIRENQEAAEKSKGNIKEISDNLTEIAESISLTANMSEDITEVLKEELESIKEVRSHTEEIAELTTQQAASTQEISAATEEQTSSMEEVDRSSMELLSLGDKMLERIRRFLD